MLEYLAFLALTMHVNLYEIDTHNTNTYIWLLLTLYMIYCQPILNGWMVRTSITVANVISNYGQRYQLKFLWKEEVKFKFELLDWHKTQTKYRSEEHPDSYKNALILFAFVIELNLSSWVRGELKVYVLELNLIGFALTC